MKKPIIIPANMTNGNRIILDMLISQNNNLKETTCVFCSKTTRNKTIRIITPVNFGVISPFPYFLFLKNCFLNDDIIYATTESVNYLSELIQKPKLKVSQKFLS